MAFDGPLVWMDCEMTGLDLATDALVEVAAVVTDGDLVPLDGGIDLVIRPPDAALAAMGDVVRVMHTESGLIDLLADGVALADAEAQLLEYVRGHVAEARKAPLAGSSIYVDRGFIARDLPALDRHLHYRLVDVSTVKELARRWYPRTYFAAPEKHGGHRALADCLESIAELRFYREALFLPPPGLDTSAARELASRHGAGALPPPPDQSPAGQPAADG